MLTEWNLANRIPTYKKGMKIDPRNQRPDRLNSAPGKIMEKILLGATGRGTMQSSGVVNMGSLRERSSQHPYGQLVQL